MAGSMMRLSPAQLQQITERAAERAVRAERQRISEEIAGRAVVERSMNDDPGPYIADVLDEIAATLAVSPGLRDAPADAERQPSRLDREPGAPIDVRRTSLGSEEVPIGPPQRVKLTPEQLAAEADRLLVPGLEREKFPGWDAALGDDGLAPVRERSDEEDVHRLVR